MDTRIIKDRIKERRNYLGIDVKEACARITKVRYPASQIDSYVVDSDSMKPNTYNKYEKGSRVPDIDILIDIATAFQCDVDYLLGLQSCATVEHSILHDKTGLSEKAITVLEHFDEIYDAHEMGVLDTEKEYNCFIEKVKADDRRALSEIICTPGFVTLLDTIDTLHQDFALACNGKTYKDLRREITDIRYDHEHDILFQTNILEQAVQDFIEEYIESKTEERK